MEPVQQPNYKTMATVLWIALITAIVVTIIDWKIKSDILRLTDAFYRVYPSQMEAQHATTAAVPPRENFTNSNGRNSSNSLLHLSVVDSDSRVEAETSPVSLTKRTEDHSADWARFAPQVETGFTDTGADANRE